MNVDNSSDPRDDLSTVTLILQILLAIGTLRYVNRTLSTMANNSWRWSPPSDWNWSKEIAVVTGGSSGIGDAIARQLADLGVRVAVLDIQECPTSDRISFYHCDVSSTESIAAAANAIRGDLGHPSILINNAGVHKPTTIMKTTESFLRKIVGVNLLAHWFTVKEFVPHMIQQNKGHIVSVASIASFIALPDGADYSATKAGSLSFHESLTLELRHFHKAYNVLTTIVHPNFVDTPLIQGASEGLKKQGLPMLTSDEVAEKIVSQIKSKQGGQLIIGGSFITTAVRSWPSWLQQLFRDILGRKLVKT